MRAPVGTGTPAGTCRGGVVDRASGHEAVGQELADVRHRDGNADREGLAKKPRPGDGELVAEPIDVVQLALRQAQLHDAIERLQIGVVKRHRR